MTDDRTGLSQRNYFILSIWQQGEERPSSVWRGCLEAPDGQRIYFATLHQLNQLLLQNGWHEGALVDNPSS